MKEQPLAVSSVLLWRIRCSAAGAVVSFLCGGIAVFSVRIALMAGAVFLIAYLYMMLFYCPRLYRNTRWEMGERFLCKKSGVIFTYRRMLPVRCIQYAQVVQSPAQRRLKICSVVFYAAGARLVVNSVSVLLGKELTEKVNGKGETANGI